MLVGPEAPLVLLPPPWRATFSDHCFDFFKPSGAQHALQSEARGGAGGRRAGGRAGLHHLADVGAAVLLELDCCMGPCSSNIVASAPALSEQGTRYIRWLTDPRPSFGFSRRRMRAAPSCGHA